MKLSTKNIELAQAKDTLIKKDELPKESAMMHALKEKIKDKLDQDLKAARATGDKR